MDLRRKQLVTCDNWLLWMFYDTILEVQLTVFFGMPAVYESLCYHLKVLRRSFRQ